MTETKRYRQTEPKQVNNNIKKLKGKKYLNVHHEETLTRCISSNYKHRSVSCHSDILIIVIGHEQQLMQHTSPLFPGSSIVM